MAALTDTKPDLEIPLTESFEIGSKAICDYRIDDDQVMDLHAVIAQKKGRTAIRDRGSRTGTLVNNRPVTESKLETGDWISIGPTMFQFLGDRLAVYKRGRMYRIDGSGLSRAVQVAPENGGAPVPLTLISDVTISVEPGEFTAIIGPSGSGKSTLLNALSARLPADTGSVAVNGQNLIDHFDELKRGIVLVPQRETIHEPLAVRTILTHTARLRMPAGTGTSALAREVTRVLDVVDLPEEQHKTAFGMLSGGQKKRVCLANELIGNPQIIFLDEVTSGLDEEADGRMMELFRKLADSGKTVIGITHNLANVERYCNRVIVLARGGRLVFTGTAEETLVYFQVPQLGDVYRRLEQDDPADAAAQAKPADSALSGKSAKAEAWRQCYERHPQRIKDRKAITSRPKAVDGSPAGLPAARPNDDSPVRRVFSQTTALVRRYVDLQLIDRPNLLSMAGTSLLVAALLVIVFGDVNVGSFSRLRSAGAHDGPMLLFLVMFSCMWFGCTAAAKEVVKEADIYRMERNHSLDLTAYYLSKLIVISTLALVQAALLYLPVKVFCQPDGNFILQATTVIVMTLAGVALGLVISSAAKTVDAAATLVPIVIIPQFVLAGAVMKVSGFSKFLSFFAALYWGHEGMLGSLPTFFKDAIDAPDWLGANVMLIVHACLYIAAGWALLRMKDKGQTTGDLIGLTRRAMSDPNGPAARYLATAKSSLVNVSRIRFTPEHDSAKSHPPRMPPNRMQPPPMFAPQHGNRIQPPPMAGGMMQPPPMIAPPTTRRQPNAGPPRVLQQTQPAGQPGGQPGAPPAVPTVAKTAPPPLRQQNSSPPPVPAPPSPRSVQAIPAVVSPTPEPNLAAPPVDSPATQNV